jgi:hypothetical protein
MAAPVLFAYYVSVSWRSLGSGGTRGAYGLNVLRHLQGQHGTRLQEIRKVPGADQSRLRLQIDIIFMPQ